MDKNLLSWCFTCGEARFEHRTGEFTFYSGQKFTIPDATWRECPNCSEQLYPEKLVRRMQAEVNKVLFSPVQMRAIGVIHYKKGSTYRIIKWCAGGSDKITYEQANDDFFALESGQWVDVKFEYDRLSWKRLRLVSVESIEPIKKMTIEEQDAYWSSLPTADSLPESNIDWSRRDE